MKRRTAPDREAEGGFVCPEGNFRSSLRLTRPAKEDQSWTV